MNLKGHNQISHLPSQAAQCDLKFLEELIAFVFVNLNDSVIMATSNKKSHLS